MFSKDNDNEVLTYSESTNMGGGGVLTIKNMKL